MTFTRSLALTGLVMLIPKTGRLVRLPLKTVSHITLNTPKLFIRTNNYS